MRFDDFCRFVFDSDILMTFWICMEFCQNLTKRLIISAFRNPPLIIKAFWVNPWKTIATIGISVSTYNQQSG